VIYRRSRRIGLVVICVFLFGPANVSWAEPHLDGSTAGTTADEGPQELMAALSTRLFALLDRDRARIRQSPERAVLLVDELLSPHFDANYTARLVLGTHWRSATADQRQRFGIALYRTLLWTYAEAVSGWTADRFRILPPRGDPSASQVVVRTEVARVDAPAIAVDYRLHRTDEGWRIFDVIVDGVSYARSYHDDIDGDIEHNGLDATIARLEERQRSNPAQRHP
jgi:phospholipid transport system substrate-binding protein